MAEQEEDRGVLGSIGNHLKERAKAFIPEVTQTLTDKVIPHGASETAHLLNTGSAYVPYGAAQAPLEPEADQGTVHGKAAEPTYEEYLNQQRGREQDQDRGIDR
jgi:hypothetical protein